jgi:hypothetical protein
MDLGERINPASASDLRKTLVEPLNDARTTLADFFSILLGFGSTHQWLKKLSI